MKPIALMGNGPALRRTSSLLHQAEVSHDSTALTPGSDSLESLERLAGSGNHDVVVFDATSIPPAERDPARLVRLVENWNHETSLVVLADFGRSSSLHHWSVDHIGLQAAGLWAGVTGAPERAPLPTRSTVLESLVAYAVTSAIHLLRYTRERADHARPALVWLSRLEVALSCQPYFDLRYRYVGRDSARTGMPFPMMLCPAADGFLGVNVLTDDQWYLLCALADRGDLLDDERFDAPGKRLVEGTVLTREFRAWAATVEAEPTFHRAQEMRVPLGYLPPVDELRSRLSELRRAVDHDPEDVATIVPSGVDRTSVPAEPTEASELTEPADPADQPSSAWSAFDTAAAGAGPLAGLRVVDLSMFWAGPLATLFLAVHGATVVKVESPTRLDGWRGLAGVESIESSHLFNGVNLNKLDVSLNLKDAEDRARLDALIAGADVLVENYSPGVLYRFGLDDDRLRSLNPHLVHLSMPAFGSTGEWRDYVGFAPTIEQLSGLPQLTRYHHGDEPRLLGNSVADPAGGWGGIAAVLSELNGRREDRSFVRLDLSQHRSLQGMLAPDLEALGAPVDDDFALIRCTDPDAGRDDAWVVVSFSPGRSPAELRTWIEAQADHWTAATPANGATDHRFAGDKWDAATQLQCAGFSAMPVLHASDVVQAGSRLGRDHCLVELDKADVGRNAYAGLPLDFVDVPPGLRWPGPTVGEHNDLITEPTRNR